jgi:cyanophycin synthetase
MRITETLIMRGPNQWSDQHNQLIVFKLQSEKDLAMDDYFVQNLKTTFPNRDIEHLAGKGLEEAVLFIIKELLFSTGLHVEYSSIRDTHSKDVKRIIFSYEIELAGTYAAEAAVNITEAISKKEEYDLCAHIRELKYIKSRNEIGPTTSFILNEVKSRNLPYRQFEGGSLVTIGYGSKQKKMRTAVAHYTSGIGIEIAGDKKETKAILAQANLPVPGGMLIYDEGELEDAVSKLRYPLVLKPLDGNHGRGVTTNINNLDKAKFGFHLAKKISDAIIVEEYIPGDDYRFLVIDYKLVAVAKRTPAKITGDGRTTIQQLIDLENLNPERGDSSEHVLAKIKIDNVTEKILSDNELTVDSVLPNGKTLYLKDTANISAGGTSTDVTDLVHPDNVFLAERIAKMFTLDICGIDILSTDITVPLTKQTGAIIEVNAGPGIRMHTNPTEGIARNVAKPMIDMLFPDNDGRIPIVAVTGTNGKTTTTRLISHLAKTAGYKPGYTTTEGIYLQGHLIQEGDCTGPQSAQTVLFDPTIDFAVLECARGGIVRSGLGFDHCDVSIVTNITEDHLGLKDVHTLEEMARVKSVVPRSTWRDGYAILNADDDLVYNMQGDLNCKIALFSMDENNERVVDHYKNGGLAAVIEKGYVVVYNGNWKTRIEKLVNIPLTFGGKAESMIKNILPAVLAATAQKFDVEAIRKGLRNFAPSPENTPGRMNLFPINNFEVMVDYAHNADGFTQLKKYIDRTEASKKIGVIAATGDRKDDDIRNLGRIAAQMLTEIVIRHDKDLRGRPAEEHSRLLLEGIRSERADIPVEVIQDEKEAIMHAVSKAEKGSFVLVCADHVQETIRMVSEIKKELESTKKTNGHVA